MKLKWTVEFEVDESWVADGFDLDDEQARDMIEKRLGWAYSDEFDARVISAPPREQILKLQGYETEIPTNEP